MSAFSNADVISLLKIFCCILRPFGMSTVWAVHDLIADILN